MPDKILFEFSEQGLKNIADRLATIESELSKVGTKGKQAFKAVEGSVGELNTKLKQLDFEINNMVEIGSKKQKELIEEYKNTKIQIDNIKNAMRTTATLTQSVAAGMKQAFEGLKIKINQDTTALNQLSNAIKSAKNTNTVAIAGMKNSYKQLETSINADKAALNQLESKMLTQGQVTSGVAKGMKEAFVGIGMAIAGAMVVYNTFNQLFTKSIAAYQEQIASEAKLTTALGYRSQALLDQAKIQQDLTLIHDDEIIAAQAQLKIMGLAEQQILALIPTMLDFAKSQGITAVEAATKLGTTLNGGRNALEKFGIELTGANGSTERLAQMTEGLTAKVGGQAEAWANSQGELERSKISFSELSEAIGGVLVGSSGFLGNINGIIDGLAEWIKGSHEQSVKLEEEKFHLNALVASATDVNIKQEDRLRLIKDIQKEYPDFLTNVEAEKITNEQLNTELLKVNASYDKKIKTMVLSEDLVEVQKKGIKLYREEATWIDEVARAKEQYAKNETLANKITLEHTIIGLKNRRDAIAKNTKEATDLQLAYNKLVVDSEANNIEKEKELTEAEKEELKKKQEAKQADLKKAGDDLDKYMSAEEEAAEKEWQIAKELQDKKNALVETEKTDRIQWNNQKLMSVQKEHTALQKSYKDKKEGLLKERKLANELAEEEITDAIALEKRKAEIKAEYDAKDKDNEKTHQDEILEIKKGAVEAATELANAVVEIIGERQRWETEQELTEIETRRKNELDNKLLTEAQTNAINLKYDAEEEKLKKKQFERDKRLAILKAFINAASAFVAAWIEPTPIAIGKVIAIAATLAANIAVIAAQKFAKGKIDIQGGQEGKDSIPALLMPRESVITAKSTMKYKSVLQAINDDRLDEHLTHVYLPKLLAKQKGNTFAENFAAVLNNSNVFDDTRLYKEIKRGNKITELTTNKLIKVIENKNKKRLWTD